MKKTGLTIAEVLVTLTIIGVVAAMSLPTIISSYRKESYASTLATAISNFETGIKNMMLQENADNLFGTSAWKQIGSTLNNTTSIENKRLFAGDVSQYINLAFNEDTPSASDFYENIELRSINDNIVNIANYDIFSQTVPYTSQGGIVYFIQIPNNMRDVNAISEIDTYQRNGNLTDTAANIIIDINGKKSPNIIGRDIFGFALGHDGTLYPMGSVDYSIKFSNTENAWDNINSTYACTDNIKREDGFGCTARLIENRYKMNY